MEAMSGVFASIITALEPVLMWFTAFQIPGSDGSPLGGESLVVVLTTGAAACVGIVFMWWGVRKVVQMVMSAFRSGRISL